MGDLDVVTQIEKMKNEIKQYQEKNESLRQTLHVKNMELCMLKTMKSEIEADNENMKKVIWESEGTESKKHDNYETITDLKEMIKTCEQELETKRKESLAKVTGLQRKIDDINLTTSNNIEISHEMCEKNISLLNNELRSMHEALCNHKQNSDALKKEIVTLNETLSTLKRNSDELNSVLVSKTNELQSSLEALEEIREEKAGLFMELSTLKAPKDDLSRGNSLFAEIEDNHQVLSQKLVLMKTKYDSLSKSLVLKTAELNKLQVQNLELHKQLEVDLNKTRSEALNRLQEFKTQMDEKLAIVQEIEKRSETPQFVTHSQHGYLDWVHTVVKEARSEADKVRAELEKRSLEHVCNCEMIHKAQQTVRSLRAQVSSSRAEIKELKLRLAQCQASQSLSPPSDNKNENQQVPKSSCSDDIADLKHHKKAVRFTEDS